MRNKRKHKPVGSVLNRPAFHLFHLIVQPIPRASHLPPQKPWMDTRRDKASRSSKPRSPESGRQMLAAFLPQTQNKALALCKARRSPEIALAYLGCLPIQPARLRTNLPAAHSKARKERLKSPEGTCLIHYTRLAARGRRTSLPRPSRDAGQGIQTAPSHPRHSTAGRPPFHRCQWRPKHCIPGRTLARTEGWPVALRVYCPCPDVQFSLLSLTLGIRHPDP